MLNSIFNTKKINYTSTLNEDHLRQEIKRILDKSDSSFVGRFTSQNNFAIYDKWTYIKWYVPNIKRRTAYLFGEILDSGKGTILKLNIKPNPLIAIFPILTILIGLIIVTAAYLNNQTLIFGLIVITIGTLFYLFGMFLVRRLQNNFKKYLDLQKLPT